MALDPVVNFFRSQIATLPVASGGTVIVLPTGDGNKLPNPATDGAFNLTIYNADDPFVTPEIVRVTGRSGDTLTVTRAQEGTSATNKTAGSTWSVELTPTAKTIQDIDSKKVEKTGDTMTGTLTATKLIPSGNVTAGNGMYLPAANTVAVSTNGSEALRVDSSQRVAIGTTTQNMLLNVQNSGIVGGTVRTPNASGTTVSIYTISCVASTDSSGYNMANGVLKVAIGGRAGSGNAVATYTLPFMLSRIGRNAGIVVLTQGTPTLLATGVNTGNISIDTVTVALSSSTNTAATMDITVTTAGSASVDQLVFNSSLEITQHSRATAAFTINPA
jgi:hypothetical protein